MQADINLLLKLAHAVRDGKYGQQKIALSTLGLRILNDGKFFTKLEEKGDCMVSTGQKVEDWFAENTPILYSKIIKQVRGE